MNPDHGTQDPTSASPDQPPGGLTADALRVLVVVHQLGQTGAQTNGLPTIDGEGQLQSLDHLVRHPRALVWLLLDDADHRRLSATERAEQAQRVRDLLAAPVGSTAGLGVLPSKTGPRRRATPFRAGTWERWDDLLAALICRDLLRVATRPGHPGELRYTLTELGIETLERDVYPSHRHAGVYRQRCRALAEVLSREAEDHSGALNLRRRLERLENHAQELRLEALASDDDTTFRQRFQATFGEQL